MNMKNTPLRLSIGAGLVFAALAFFISAANGFLYQSVLAAPAPSPTPPALPASQSSKIDPLIVKEFASHPDKRVPVIIYMSEKADLSEPNFAKASDSLEEIKAQRDEVYQVLTDTAQKSQAPLLNLLEGSPGCHSLCRIIH